ncbi:hypothetical protein Pcinc_014770 [Petrolisthes cinctipes]|uniref:Secreted protein n=1 Tax=Petrolisthes cinctipes TaxID=88211 RepID=A0AAE1FX48_PETCI|nr:hypothetical protein Pcinc_014770 [Petrolisthes cinctipes]
MSHSRSCVTLLVFCAGNLVTLRSFGHALVVWSRSGRLVTLWSFGHAPVVWSRSGRLVTFRSFGHAPIDQRTAITEEGPSPGCPVMATKRMTP